MAGNSYSGLILIAALTALLFGVVLSMWGWFGKRMDDHPWCRNCRFDLFGVWPDRKQCPECGADLSIDRAVRTGTRQRRTIPLAIGVPLLVVSLLPTILLARTWVSQFDFNPFKPDWWLLNDVVSLDQSRTRGAVREAAARMDEAALTAEQVQVVVEEILALQANQAVRWDTEWGALVEFAFDRAQLAEGQIETYLTQAANYELRARETMPIGYLWPVEFVVLDCRISDRRPFRLRWKITDWQFPSPTPIDLNMPDFTMMSPGGSYTMSFALNLPAAPGTYDLRLGGDMSIVDSRSDSVLISWYETLTRSVEVLPTEQPSIVLNPDPVIARQIQDKLVQVTAMELPHGAESETGDMKILELRFKIGMLPANIAADVVIMAGDREWGSEQIVIRRGSATNRSTRFPVPQEFSFESIDVRLVPSRRAAISDQSMDEILGEEISFNGIPVSRGDPKPDGEDQ